MAEQPTDPLEELALLILRLTEAGAIAWRTPTADPDWFIYSLASGSVDIRLVLHQVLAGNISKDTYQMRVFNTENVIVNTLTQEGDDSTLGRLYNTVRTTIVTSEETIRSMLAELQGVESFHVQFNREDQDLAKRFDLSQYSRISIRAHPSEDSKGWRLGLGFSSDISTPSGRFGPGHPLWHLTKDPRKNVLAVDYYDVKGKYAPQEIAWEGYAGQEVQVRIIVSHSFLDISIGGGYEQRLLLHDHRFMRLFAWADGHGYQLDVTVEAHRQEGR
jgi:hypothetical protein